MDARWILGGVCAAAGLGLLLYVLSDDGKPPRVIAKGPPLRRDQLVEILKEIKKESSGVFVMIAGFATSVKQQTEGKIDDETLRTVLLSNAPVGEQMERVETKVYEKFRVSEEQVKKAYSEFFASDPEVQQLTRDVQEGLENALIGMAPQYGQKLPDFLTPDKVVEILADIYQVSESIASQRIPQMRSRGVQFNPYSKDFVQEMQRMEQDTEEAKEGIFKRHGLGDLSDSPALMLNQAVQAFSSNPMFMAKLSKLENTYKTNMQGIMMSGMSPEERMNIARQMQAGQMGQGGPEAGEEEPTFQFDERGGIEKEEQEYLEFLQSQSAAHSKVQVLEDQ